MQELSVLFCALVLDAIIGDPRSKWHPVCLMGNFAYRLETSLRQGSQPWVLFGRGALAWAMVVSVSVALAVGMVAVGAWLGGNAGAYGICMLILTFCMAPKSLSQHAQAIITPLAKGDVASAREKLSMIVGRDVRSLDTHGIARAGIESISENLVDGVLASLFWGSVGLYTYGYGGAAALVVLHRASNVLDAQWGKRNEKYAYFGKFSARADDVLNWIPARLSLFCICCVAMTQRLLSQRSWCMCGIRELFTVAWKYRYAHASPNSAWSEAAFASALQVQLGGSVLYGDMQVHHPFIGQGTRCATVQHMHKAVLLLWLSTGLWLLCTACLWWLAS